MAFKIIEPVQLNLKERDGPAKKIVSICIIFVYSKYSRPTHTTHHIHFLSSYSYSYLLYTQNAERSSHFRRHVPCWPQRFLPQPLKLPSVLHRWLDIILSSESYLQVSTC